MRDASEYFDALSDVRDITERDIGPFEGTVRDEKERLG